MSGLEFIRLPAARNVVFSRYIHGTQTGTDVDVVCIPTPKFRRNPRCSEIRVFSLSPHFWTPWLKKAVNSTARCTLGGRCVWEVQQIQSNYA